jgi:hypothetical protein
MSDQSRILVSEGPLRHGKRFSLTGTFFTLAVCMVLLFGVLPDIAGPLLVLTGVVFAFYVFCEISLRHRLVHLPAQGLIEERSGLFFQSAPRARYRVGSFNRATLRIEYRARRTKHGQVSANLYHVELLPRPDAKASALYCGTSGQLEDAMLHAARIAGALGLPLTVPAPRGPDVELEAATVADAVRRLPPPAAWRLDFEVSGFLAMNTAYTVVLILIGAELLPTMFLYGSMMAVLVGGNFLLGAIPALSRQLSSDDLGTGEKILSVVIGLPVAMVFGFGVFMLFGGFLLEVVAEREQLRSIADVLAYLHRENLWLGFIALPIVYFASIRTVFRGGDAKLTWDLPFYSNLIYFLFLVPALALRDVLDAAIGTAAGTAGMVLILVFAKSACDVAMRHRARRTESVAALRRTLNI